MSSSTDFNVNEIRQWLDGLELSAEERSVLLRAHRIVRRNQRFDMILENQVRRILDREEAVLIDTLKRIYIQSLDASVTIKKLVDVNGFKRFIFAY